MKIGLYPGTFNPLHIGHITVINYSLESYQLDLIYIIPNKYPVHKKRKYILDPQTRLKIIQLSIENMVYKSKIKVSDFEIKSPEDSYTFITIEHFRKNFPNDELFLIIGADSIIYYYWHNFELILKMIDYIVIVNNLSINGNIFDFIKEKLLELHNQEKEYNKDLLNLISYYEEEIKNKFLLLDIPNISVSSSLILERIIANKSVDYWVNDKVKIMLQKIIPLAGN